MWIFYNIVAAIIETYCLGRLETDRVTGEIYALRSLFECSACSRPIHDAYVMAFANGP